MHADDESVDFDFAAIEATESRKDRAHDALVLAGFTSRQIAEIFRAIGPVFDETNDAQPAPVSHDDGAVIVELIRNILLHIEAAGHQAPLEAMLHRFAFDFRTSNAESMRHSARMWGMSPEAISKRVDAIRRRHGLSASSFNRPDSVCTQHKLTNRHRR